MSDEKPSEAFSIRLTGKNTADVQTITEALSAMDGLFDAVASEVVGPDHGIKLEIVGMRIVCDGCDRTRPPDASGWVQSQNGMDFCPECAASGEAT